MGKVTVKNTSKGFRGLFNAQGLMVTIDPGASASDDFAAADVADFKKMLKAEQPQGENEADLDDGEAEVVGNEEPALEGSVKDLQGRLADMDDVDELKRLHGIEKRTTGQNAIQARIDELNA